MTDPQDTITVHTIEGNEESKNDSVAYTPPSTSASSAQEKYKYRRMKDAVTKMRNKARRAAFGSDPLLLATHDLRYHQRYNMCNEYCGRRGYRVNGIPEIRWRRERPPGPPMPYYPGPGMAGNRRWNFSTIDFTRPPFEMSTSPARRRYLQRSLTSSELVGSSYKRCLPAIPLQKSQKNSLYGSSKSVHAYDCVQPKTETVLITKSDMEKENQSTACSISETPVQVQNHGSAYSSSSDGSLDPKTLSTVSTLPMGSPKHGDTSPGPTFGSQFSLSGSQCCQNCHVAPCQKMTTQRWHSQSTVGEGHYVPADGSNDGLSWRRLHMSRAKLKATATTSELLSGFAMVAMVELQINEPTNVPEWLFIIFSVTTTVLVAVHIFALMISTYLLPNIDAASKLHSTKLFTESPHERMKGFIELAWAFSTVLGLFLFLVEVAILCWVKFWDFSLRAAMAATIIVIPVLIIFIIFVFHFWRVLVVHKCKSTIKSIHELEEMRKKLDSVSPV